MLKWLLLLLCSLASACAGAKARMVATGSLRPVPDLPTPDGVLPNTLRVIAQSALLGEEAEKRLGEALAEHGDRGFLPIGWEEVRRGATPQYELMVTELGEDAEGRDRSARALLLQRLGRSHLTERAAGGAVTGWLLEGPVLTWTFQLTLRQRIRDRQDLEAWTGNSGASARQDRTTFANSLDFGHLQVNLTNNTIQQTHYITIEATAGGSLTSRADRERAAIDKLLEKLPALVTSHYVEFDEPANQPPTPSPNRRELLHRSLAPIEARLTTLLRAPAADLRALGASLRDLDRLAAALEPTEDASSYQDLRDLRAKALRGFLLAQDPQAPAGAETRQATRFAFLEAPDYMTQDTRFTAVVTLSESSLGALGDAARSLAMPDLPANDTAWELSVSLLAPHCRFEETANCQTITLTRAGNAVLARFDLRIPPQVEAEATNLVARISHRGQLLATLTHRVAIDPPVTKGSTARTALAGAGDVLQPVFFDPMGRSAPDLTLVVDSLDDGRTHCLVLSPHFAVPRSETIDARAIRPWLRSRALLVNGLLRGEPDPASDRPLGPDSAADLLRGLGKELWERTAPRVFRERFVELKRTLGARFTSIAIYTDDPEVPWELMRPGSDDAQGTADYLGVTHRIGRWHIAPGSQTRTRPLRALALQELAVLAPDYTGALRLPTLAAERDYLVGLPGAHRIPANYAGLRSLLADLPNGIVHFAGHGTAQATANAPPAFSMRLEDGDVDPTTWRGMAPTNARKSTLFFFNACDMGQTARVAAFVDGWAPTMMELGSCGCIAAICPVQDEGAARFARSFYAGAFAAAPNDPICVAELVRKARAELLAQGSLSGLTFVYYGDPDLHIVRP